jgi:hypothetical protein
MLSEWAMRYGPYLVLGYLRSGFTPIGASFQPAWSPAQRDKINEHQRRGSCGLVAHELMDLNTSQCVFLLAFMIL